MGDWKKQLEEFEQQEQWKAAIELMQQVVKDNLDDVEAYVRIIYLLHNVVLEVYTEVKKAQGINDDKIETLLKHYFSEGNRKFAENAEYLFFIGMITHIAEWYFGIEESINLPMEKHFATKMQKKASDFEPENKLYKWAYLSSSVDNRYSSPIKDFARSLAKGLIEDTSTIEWLKSKGFPGQYVLEVQLKGSIRNSK